MQSVHAGWSGKTFAIAAARCSDPRDKKPRSRRSKEERKTMVESFIKKYQDLNNGKFPSLNLTHKEVGGSFYTVREIVREVIQQNRILVPGYSTSKALTFECCPEEQTGEALSVDISASLSISTFNHSIDQRQGESLSLYNEHRTTNAGMIEIDEYVNQEDNESHPNVTFAVQVPDGEKSENLCCKGPNLGRLSGITYENSGLCEQIHAEVQVHSSKTYERVDYPFPSGEAVSVTSSQVGSVVNGDYNRNISNDTIRGINSSETSDSHLLSDRLFENEISSGSTPPSASLNCKEDTLRASASAKTYNAIQPQKRIDMITPLEVPKTFESDEMSVAFMPFEKDSVIERSKTTKTISSIVAGGTSAIGLSGQISPEEDLNMDRLEKAETRSSIDVGEVSNGDINGSLSQNLDCPASVNISPMMHPLLQPNVISKTRSAPHRPMQPIFKDKNFSKIKHQREHSMSRTESARSYDSISTNEIRKECGTSEPNPAWVAIKSFLRAVIKFWRE